MRNIAFRKNIDCDGTLQGLREGGSRDTSYPGPGLGGARKSSGFRVKFWYRTKTSYNQTCLQQKYQSAYSELVIGRYFCYTAFRASNSGRFD